MNQFFESLYEGPLQEVIDSVQEALVICLLTQDLFPMDEVTQNDEHNGPELENPKWKRVIDGLFKTALERMKTLWQLVSYP